MKITKYSQILTVSLSVLALSATISLMPAQAIAQETDMPGMSHPMPPHDPYEWEQHRQQWEKDHPDQFKQMEQRRVDMEKWRQDHPDQFKQMEQRREDMEKWRQDHPDQFKQQKQKKEKKLKENLPDKIPDNQE